MHLDIATLNGTSAGRQETASRTHTAAAKAVVQPSRKRIGEKPVAAHFALSPTAGRISPEGTLKKRLEREARMRLALSMTSGITLEHP